MDTINSRYAYIRTSKNLNKKKFADSLGIAASVSGDIELGKIGPSRDVLIKLFLMYKVNINWLLTGEGEIFLTEKHSGNVIIGSSVIGSFGSNANISIDDKMVEKSAVEIEYEELFQLLYDYATPKMIKELKQRLLKVKEATEE